MPVLQKFEWRGGIRLNRRYFVHPLAPRRSETSETPETSRRSTCSMPLPSFWRFRGLKSLALLMFSFSEVPAPREGVSQSTIRLFRTFVGGYCEQEAGLSEMSGCIRAAEQLQPYCRNSRGRAGPQNPPHSRPRAPRGADSDRVQGASGLGCVARHGAGFTPFPGARLRPRFVLWLLKT